MAQSFASAACGKCVPCREGTAWLATALERLEEGAAESGDRDWIYQRCAQITPDVALCGHGPAAARGIQALGLAFADEFEAHLDGGCPVTKDLLMKVPDSIHMRF